MITVVDLGMGNVASVQNMLLRLGAGVRLLDTPPGHGEMGPVVLPGVGAYDTGVRRLRSNGWFEFLRDLPTSHPVLGICLGMQLLGALSDEGTERGLGRIQARFEKLEGDGLRVPHMGWNQLRLVGRNRLFEALPPNPRFYFAHSYAAQCHDPEDIIATAYYGRDFPAAYCKGSTYGVQFHPEKSHRFGLGLLGAWLEQIC